MLFRHAFLRKAILTSLETDAKSASSRRYTSQWVTYSNPRPVSSYARQVSEVETAMRKDLKIQTVDPQPADTATEYFVRISLPRRTS